MKIILSLIAAAGLMLTLVPSILVFAGKLEWQTHSTLMLLGMLCWFCSAPWLMKSKKTGPSGTQ